MLNWEKNVKSFLSEIFCASHPGLPKSLVVINCRMMQKKKKGCDDYKITIPLVIRDTWRSVAPSAPPGGRLYVSDGVGNILRQLTQPFSNWNRSERRLIYVAF